MQKKHYHLDRTGEYFAFLAMQQCLNAQSERIGALDASLGVLVLMQASVLLYLLGLQHVATPALRIALTIMLVLATLFTLLVLSFVRATESPHAAQLARGLRTNVDETIDAAMTAMATDFSANEMRIRTKNRVLRFGFIATFAVAVIASAVH